ncbi:hypothetical protein EC973_005260 [Apophysomyces ossiformis]|uniref:Monooxygenase n=1 Tax=Apophysomyces ossiformis TaxID=679940 RepID=A0A8H7ETP4_9FUNG|nr:hypothetical protein EC973_005260 [Apophysomyces ossiformis]
MSRSETTVAVIGAGFSGLCAAIQLKKQLGIKAQIFEASEDVGGTWLHNTYPGCACDVPSHMYSLSFELNPDWPERYSSQPEILRYMRNVSAKYGLYEHITFEAEVVRTTWLESEQKWRVEWRHKQSDTIQSSLYDFVFAGVGPLRVPRAVDQFSAFQGPILHTAYWDDKVDVTNKRVAVVGSGASAVQTIPKLARLASSLTSYQRTPVWCMPRKQRAYSDRVKTIFRWFPWIMWLYRFILYIKLELLYIPFGYPHSYIVRYLHSLFVKHMKGRLESQGRGDLAEKVIPDFTPGCKRVVVSEDYLESLCRPNVTVERSGIREIRGRTIICENGTEAEYDILCLATGFDVQGFLGHLQVYGKDNQSLNDLWDKEYPETYKSVSIHGFPNFFMLLGPASVLGHNSVVSMVECQVDFAIRSMKYMAKHNFTALEAKKEAQKQFVAKLNKEIQSTVWASGCKSWYINDKGQIFALWSGTVTGFWWTLLRTNYAKDFIGYRPDSNN